MLTRDRAWVGKHSLAKFKNSTLSSTYEGTDKNINQTRRQGLPNVFIPRHKMEIVLLGICVYGTLLKLYILFQLFQNNDVK